LSGTPLPKYLEQQERELVLAALRANDWVQKDAARQLGISPRVLCYKIKRLKIELPGTQTDA
jgi:transcriptional regulator with GAF, ATPase, and Fis domain